METTINPKVRYDLPEDQIPKQPPSTEQTYRWGILPDATQPQAKPIAHPARGVSFLGGWLSFVGELTRA